MLTELNWKLIDTRTWKLNDVEKQARMAELLVHRQVGHERFAKIIVWNSSVGQLVAKTYAEVRVKPPQIVEDLHFFFNKYPDARNESLITGPYFTRRKYAAAADFILKKGQTPTAPHRNIDALLTALRRDGLTALPETAELIGLETDNPMHEEDAGTHTLSVVRCLTCSDEFKSLSPNDQMLTEFAAFCHDIGKGPKSRWRSNEGKQKVDPDHPIRSTEMLKRILTTEIATIKPRSVKVICKLACYHDLLGDIVGKGRDVEQLEEIAETEAELEMLIALGLADVRAIEEHWYANCREKVGDLRRRVVSRLRAATPESEA